MYLTQKSRLHARFEIIALVFFAQVLLPLCLMQPASADPPSEQFALATNYYQQSRWTEAAKAFDEFSTQFPEHVKVPLAMFYRAEALVQGRQYATAHEAFAAFLKKHPEHQFSRQSLYRTGEMAHLIGKRAEAREALNKFCRTYSSDPILAYAVPYLGEIEFRDGNFALAEKRYLMALDAFPNGPMADSCRFGLARALQLQNRFDEAVPLFEGLVQKPRCNFSDDAQFQICMIHQTVGDHDKAIAGLSEFLTRFDASPLKINATYWLGISHAGQNNWGESARVLKIAALHIEAEAKDHELAPAVYFGAGQAYRRQNENDIAKTYYRAVIDRWAKSQWSDDSYEVLVQMAFEAGEHSEVKSLAAIFGQQFPNSELSFSIDRTVGRSMLAQEMYQSAIEQFLQLQNAQEIAKEDAASIQYLLGVAYAGDEQYQKSIDALSSVEARKDDIDFNASVAIARATSHFNLKNDKQAVPSQTRYLALKPNGLDAEKCRAELAISLARLNRFEESMAAYHELQQKHPEYEGRFETTYFLAEAAYSAKQQKMSEELFTWLAREGHPPEYVQKGLYGLAWIRSDENDTAKTAEAFQLLLDRFPNSDLANEAVMMRARSLQKSGKLNEAFDAYLLLIEEFPQSKHVADAMLAAARIKSGNANQADKAAAVELLEQFEKQFPKHEQVDGAIYDLAWAMLDLKRDEESNEVFHRLYNRFPESRFWGDVTYRLAEQAAHAGDRKKAETLTAELIDANTSDEIRCHALYLHGQLAADGGDWKRVTETMEQIVENHAGSSLHLPAEYWVAESLFRREEYKESQRRFNSLNEKTVNKQDSWLAMVPLRLAQTFAKEKQWTKAYDAATTIADRFENFRQQYEADYLIGRCLANKAKFTEAREAYQRAVQSTTGGSTETAAMAQWMIGETYFHQRKYDEAIKAYHRVETLYAFPQWQAAALLQAGKCYEKKGDFESSIKVYGLLLKNYGETSSAAKASERLRSVKGKVASAAQRRNS